MNALAWGPARMPGIPSHACDRRGTDDALPSPTGRGEAVRSVVDHCRLRQYATAAAAGPLLTNGDHDGQRRDACSPTELRRWHTQSGLVMGVVGACSARRRAKATGGMLRAVAYWE